MAPFHTHALLESSTIAHAFFGRHGGVSTGIYDSLNCGTGSNDNPHHVAENRARAAHALGFETNALSNLYQIHSPTVLTLTAPLGTARPEADAMVTCIPGMLLGILTADCAPVLFADARAGVIGAAHAGWKGAFTGVLENTVAAMEALGAARANIVAIVGPCIAQASYEVGPEFMARLVEADAKNISFFCDSPITADHALFDLPGYVLHRLRATGLREAQWIGMDTRPDDAPFFSYRRKTINAEADYGRQMSVIGVRC